MSGKIPLRQRFLLESFRPIYELCNPYFDGLEHVDAQKPSLIVANHTTLGVLDIPFFYYALVKERGVHLRGLAHRIFFSNPASARILKELGAVEGTRENCSRLMKSGEHILVFPGGGLEVNKTKNQKYQLLWEGRSGFAIMAAAHDYPIVPLASVGAEEAYDIRLDRTDLLATPFAQILKRFAPSENEIPPIVTGWKGTPLPKPERFYFKFMPPIPTAHVDPEDEVACQALKDQTQAAIESAIRELQEIQESDPTRNNTWFKNLRDNIG